MIEQTGSIVIAFSQDMHIVPDLSMIKKGKAEVNGKKQPVFDV